MAEGARFLAKKSPLPPWEVFSPTRMSPGKTDLNFFRACGRELCEAF